MGNQAELRLTFKKRPRSTGIDTGIDIKVNGHVIGHIGAFDQKIRVTFQYHASKRHLAVFPTRYWMWELMESKFDSPEAAKAWVEANFARLLPNLRIYFPCRPKASAHTRGE